MFNKVVVSSATTSTCLTKQALAAAANSNRGFFTVAQQQCAPTKMLLKQQSPSYVNMFGNSMMPVRAFGVVQEVPSMGDSITEGVVESYVKSK